jgi:hypothetical protein
VVLKENDELMRQINENEASYRQREADYIKDEEKKQERIKEENRKEQERIKEAHQKEIDSID